MWLLVLPLAAVGWLAAHSLISALAAPESARLHSDAGHGYIGVLTPVVLACASTLLVAGLALAIADGLRDRARSPLPGWPVALVPPLGFAVQEHVERWIATDAVPIDVALEPAFLAGIALQLPFALAALLVARAVLALGHHLGRVLPAPRSPRPPARPVALNPLDRLKPELPRPAILATGHSERGPPLAAAA